MKQLVYGLVAATLAVAVVGTAAGADEAANAARARSAAVQQAEPAALTPPSAAAPVTPAAPRPRKAPSHPPVAADAAPKGAKAMDRLELDRTQITGSRELPKVMVIVPWKRSDIGDLAGRPFNSLVDEALQPVDREVFRREISYYGALAPDRPRAETHVTGGDTPRQPEK